LGLISGLYVLISLLRGNYQAYSALPFGPFLALSALGLLFFKELLA
jgi:prepilin signal peptidase PulO-like enzyme (type II secretory pathway)